MATRGPMPPPGPIGEHCVSRVTRGGKLLTYRLVVVQEPHRARACGAGAKCAQRLLNYPEKRHGRS